VFYFPSKVVLPTIFVHHKEQWSGQIFVQLVQEVRIVKALQT